MTPLPSDNGRYVLNPSGPHYHHSTSNSNLDSNSQISVRVLSRPSPNELAFELINVDVSFANALRRIMIAEVPTMALEHVYLWNNTSLIHDEVLAHRLGLIPLKVDPRAFDEYGLEVDEGGELASTDRNTIVFKMNVTCGRNEKEDEKWRLKMEKKWKAEGLVSGYHEDIESNDNKNKGIKKEDELYAVTDVNPNDNEQEEKDPSVMDLTMADRAAKEAVSLHWNQQHRQVTPIDTPNRPFTKHVYTRDLLWAPQGDQLAHFPLYTNAASIDDCGGIRPVAEDILLAKLRPGQVIELEAHARKGVGKDHAKFSPVSTASYRLMTNVEIVKPIYDELAEELVNWYEPGVFTLVPVNKHSKEEKEHRVKAQVSNPYACTMSRNYMRNPILKESIIMSRIPNHFIFSVESVGMMEPAVIVAEALKILKAKCEKVIELSDESMAMDE